MDEKKIRKAVDEESKAEWSYNSRWHVSPHKWDRWSAI